jgi:hypothetical protein
VPKSSNLASGDLGQRGGKRSLKVGNNVWWGICALFCSSERGGNRNVGSMIFKSKDYLWNCLENWLSPLFETCMIVEAPSPLVKNVYSQQHAPISTLIPWGWEDL